MSTESSETKFMIWSMVVGAAFMVSFGGIAAWLAERADERHHRQRMEVLDACIRAGATDSPCCVEAE